jgi:hypothetical protein
MGPHPRLFAIVAAVLWLGSGLGGRAEGSIILQTPAGLNRGTISVSSSSPTASVMRPPRTSLTTTVL